MKFKYPMSILLAVILDLIVGDPATWPHPVKTIGRFISFLDKRLNKNRKIDGVWMLGLVLLVVYAFSKGILVFAYQLNFTFGLSIEAMMIATTISQKGLKDAALKVYQPLTQNDIPRARKYLAHIVGRDTDILNEAEITRATVETVAENTTDGITAPLFWAFLTGGVGAMIYRAINTCDSMVGYQNKQYQNFGWFSAKVDDLVNWLPARLTGIIMLYATPKQIKDSKPSLTQLKREANKHASPNSGWTEAAVALGLGIQLGGYNYYQGVLSKAQTIGQSNRPLEREDIKKTIQSMHITSLLFLLLIMLGAIIYEFTKTWS